MRFTTEKSFVMSLMLMTTPVELLEMRVFAVWPLIRLSTANCHPRRERIPPHPPLVTLLPGVHIKSSQLKEIALTLLLR